MLQVIERKFEKLEEVIKYINKVSIKYGYLKDYQIIRGVDTYSLILKFDVPECKQVLELANLKQIVSEDQLIYKTSYNIELEDRSAKTSSNICFIDLKNGFEIQGYFDYDGVFNLIQIDYDVQQNLYTIELRNFKNGIYGWSTKSEKMLHVENIDYKIIYNHLVKLIFNRGYLVDISGLNDLEENLFYIANWLNKKEFDKRKMWLSVVKPHFYMYFNVIHIKYNVLYYEYI